MTSNVRSPFHVLNKSTIWWRHLSQWWLLRMIKHIDSHLFEWVRIITIGCNHNFFHDVEVIRSDSIWTFTQFNENLFVEVNIFHHFIEELNLSNSKKNLVNSRNLWMHERITASWRYSNSGCACCSLDHLW